MIRPAGGGDVAAILECLRANREDTSLFQQPESQVRKTLGDFLLAVDGERVLGCAALHRHRADNAEILAVAVRPEAQGRGVGKEILGACIERAQVPFLWLSTAKPDYFARFGFRPVSRWRMPLPILAYKLGLVFQQPADRWLPAIFGRHTFMRHGNFSPLKR